MEEEEWKENLIEKKYGKYMMYMRLLEGKNLRGGKREDAVRASRVGGIFGLLQINPI